MAASNDNSYRSGAIGAFEWQDVPGGRIYAHYDHTGSPSGGVVFVPGEPDPRSPAGYLEAVRELVRGVDPAELEHGDLRALVDQIQGVAIYGND